MSKKISGVITCPQCGNAQEVAGYASINVSLNPELRDEFLAQNINRFECKTCQFSLPIRTDLMYHDMERGFVVYFVPSGDFDAKRMEMDSMPSFGGIANYFKHALFVNDYRDALLMVHLCEKNGAPQSVEDCSRYYDACREIKNAYAQESDEHTLDLSPFDYLDAFNDEGCEWAKQVLDICMPLTGIRTDLLPYALAMIFDDFIHIVMGYPKRDWESYLNEAFGNYEDVWSQIYDVRREVFRTLKSKIGADEISKMLERATEFNNEDESDVVYSQLSDTQRLELYNFVSNGLEY